MSLNPDPQQFFRKQILSEIKKSTTKKVKDNSSLYYFYTFPL
jgi:hypothetical protein